MDWDADGDDVTESQLRDIAAMEDAALQARCGDGRGGAPPAAAAAAQQPDWDEEDDLPESQLQQLAAIEEAALQERRSGATATALSAPAVAAAAGEPPPAAPPPRKRRLPASLANPPSSSAAAAPAAAGKPVASAAGAAPAGDENLSPAVFTGALSYLCTAYEVDQACQWLLTSGVAALGFDIEWRVTYRTGVPPRPVALIQVCWTPPTPGAAAQAGLEARQQHQQQRQQRQQHQQQRQRQQQHTCLLLHVAHSGLTPHLRQLLQSPTILKVGVGISGDAQKITRDFNLEMRGVLCLSDYANARCCVDAAAGTPQEAPSSGAAPGACGAANGSALPAQAPLPGLLAAPQKWSLAGLVARLLRLRLDKGQALRCSNWEARPPLSSEQQLYAAADAWASLRCYEVLSEMPAVAPLPPVAAAAAPAAEPAPAGGAQAQAAAAAAAAGQARAPDWVPASTCVGHLQPAKLAVYQALHQGLSVEEVAAQRRIRPDSVQGYMGAAIAAGLGYSWSALGVPEGELQLVADVCSSLLGRCLAWQPAAAAAAAQQQAQQQDGQAWCGGSKRPLPCPPGSLAAAAAATGAASEATPAAAESGAAAAAAAAAVAAAAARDERVNLSDRLQEAGHKLRDLKEDQFVDVPWGHLRLALARLSRCNPGPWE